MWLLTQWYVRPPFWTSLSKKRVVNADFIIRHSDTDNPPFELQSLQKGVVIKGFNRTLIRCITPILTKHVQKGVVYVNFIKYIGIRNTLTPCFVNYPLPKWVMNAHNHVKHSYTYALFFFFTFTFLYFFRFILFFLCICTRIQA